jgi:hypothetical protein
MNLADFDNGYWYATELKSFATSLGVPSASRLRKDELERAIKSYLQFGKLSSSPKRSLAVTTVRDTDRSLRPQRRVVGYVNNAETKSFLEREARKLSPDYRRRSGARYRLNRWREQQIANGVPITYRDLVREYVRLSRPDERFDRIPHGRYINFVSDYVAANPGATTAQAAKAWAKLKKLDVPKTYQAWTRKRRSK